MENLLNMVLRNIEIVTAIVVALSALVILVVKKYKEVMAELKAEKALTEATLPYIGAAKTNPIALAQTLVNKDMTELSKASLELDEDATKKNIVAQALIEREPKLLKKLKLKDLLQVGNFVSGVYQTVKPIIKAWK